MNLLVLWRFDNRYTKPVVFSVTVAKVCPAAYNMIACPKLILKLGAKPDKQPSLSCPPLRLIPQFVLLVLNLLIDFYSRLLLAMWIFEVLVPHKFPGGWKVSFIGEAFFPHGLYGDKSG